MTFLAIVFGGPRPFYQSQQNSDGDAAEENIRNLAAATKSTDPDIDRAIFLATLFVRPRPFFQSSKMPTAPKKNIRNDRFSEGRNIFDSRGSGQPNLPEKQLGISRERDAELETIFFQSQQNADGAEERFGISRDRDF